MLPQVTFVLVVAQQDSRDRIISPLPVAEYMRTSVQICCMVDLLNLLKLTFVLNVAQENTSNSTIQPLSVAEQIRTDVQRWLHD